jgi:hypothetical protein
MGNEFPINYTLEIDGDKFKGKAATEFAGNRQEYDIEGKRQKKDKQKKQGSGVGRSHYEREERTLRTPLRRG